MPIAVVIPDSLVVPTVLFAKDATKLVEELRQMNGTPLTVIDEDSARMWLRSLPPPSGWFESASEASEFLAKSRR